MTIGIILGILFAIITVACTVCAICFFTGSKPFASIGKKSSYEAAVRGGGRKKTVAGAVTAAGAAVSFLLFLLIPFSFHTVQAGEVAVVKHLGEARTIRNAGTYFDLWITESYDKYDAKVQNLSIKANTYSQDGQSMDITMTLQYQIDTSKAIEIANNYGTLNTLSDKIMSVTEERTKSVLSGYSAMEIIRTRASISPLVATSVKEAIDSNYHVTVNTIVLTNIDFTDAFEKTVEDKMIAEQEKLKAEYEKETAIINAEKELEVAKKQAEAKIEVARADAQAQVLVAEAEANALKAKSLEVARMLGFDIKKVSEVEKEDGTVEAEYEIDFTGKDAEQIKLINDYLKYIEYLSKWNGKLPDVMVSDSGANIMIPVNPTT